MPIYLNGTLRLKNASINGTWTCPHLSEDKKCHSASARLFETTISDPSLPDHNRSVSATRRHSTERIPRWLTCRATGVSRPRRSWNESQVLQKRLHGMDRKIILILCRELQIAYEIDNCLTSAEVRVELRVRGVSEVKFRFFVNRYLIYCSPCSQRLFPLFYLLKPVK